MSNNFRRQGLVTLLTVICATCSIGQKKDTQKLDQQYQSAVADYEAGRFAQARSRLETLLPYAPKSFEIHELLGMVYASIPEAEKSIEHLQTAVQINPDSGEARTNLGPT